MATKDQVDVEKVRKEETEKVEFILKELNKIFPSIAGGSPTGAGDQQ